MALRGCSIVIVLAAAGPCMAQATFQGVGDLPGGVFTSEALGVSPDGSRVVGYSITGANTSAAFVFTGGVLSSIGDPPGGTMRGVANAAAENGVIVGEGDAGRGTEAFKYNDGRWRMLGGTVQGGFVGSSAAAVSLDGRITVGSIELSGFRIQAARWEAFLLSPLGYLSGGGAFSAAYGVSGDGEIVVGVSDSFAGDQAFRWTSGGMVGLGDFPGGAFNSQANAISRDGSTIVGSATSTEGVRAARFVVGGAPVSLGTLGGFSEALAVSADGSVVVGRSSVGNTTEAFIWTSAEGMRPLSAVLAAAGADVSGWNIRSAFGISDDGRVVCGSGINPSGQIEGWVAVLPDPCRADFDGDGFVDFFDFDAFAGCFEGGVCPPGKSPDFDGDGFVDFFDLDAFVGAFEAGC